MDDKQKKEKNIYIYIKNKDPFHKVTRLGLQKWVNHLGKQDELPKENTKDKHKGALGWSLMETLNSFFFFYLDPKG